MDKLNEILFNNIDYEQICTLRCCRCDKIETVHDIDDYDAVDEFKSFGWRSTKFENIYCPNCAKKKLKNKG